jgi:hypothetical protein
MDRGGQSPELELYVTRVEIVGRALMGPLFYELVDEACQTERGPNPEAAAPLYDRALELLQQARERLRKHPEDYEHVIEWRNEKTIHGVGHPGLEEALSETYIDYWT